MSDITELVKTELSPRLDSREKDHFFGRVPGKIVILLGVPTKDDHPLGCANEG
jgi:hypothetical protein